jgi:futalosine hydrolase
VSVPRTQPSVPPLLVCADPREGDLLGDLGDLLVTGVGKTAAAARLAAALAAARRPVVLFGTCGAFPRGHAVAAPVLEVLDLCVVEDSVFGDEGVVVADGFLDLEALGLGSVGPFPADPAWSARAAATLGLPRVRAATVSSCSGTDAASIAVAARSRAQIETMESAACGFVCAQFGVPLLELRCVGNRTGERAAAGFRLRDAAVRAQQAVQRLGREGVIA